MVPQKITMSLSMEPVNMTLSGKYFADVTVFVYRDGRLLRWALDAITSVLVREKRREM